MKLLVDENLSPRVAVLLRDGGFDAIHILERGLGGAADSTVSETRRLGGSGGHLLGQ